MKKVVSMITIHEHQDLMLSLINQDVKDNFQELLFSLPMEDIILLPHSCDKNETKMRC